MGVRLRFADLEGRLPGARARCRPPVRLDAALLAGIARSPRTPAAPGRVLTLVPAPGAVCTGMAYRVLPEVFVHLDHREKNGYRRVTANLHLADGRAPHGVVYIAEPATRPGWAMRRRRSSQDTSPAPPAPAAATPSMCCGWPRHCARSARTTRTWPNSKPCCALQPSRPEARRTERRRARRARPAVDISADTASSSPPSAGTRR